MSKYLTNPLVHGLILAAVSVLAIMYFFVDPAPARAQLQEAQTWQTDCVPPIDPNKPYVETTLGNIALTFSRPGTSVVNHSLCEIIWRVDGNTMTAHFEIDAKVTLRTGTGAPARGYVVLKHDIPVSQAGQGLFGVVAKWGGINMPPGYTYVSVRGGAPGLTFWLNGDNVPPIFLGPEHLDPTQTITLYGTMQWWISN